MEDDLIGKSLGQFEIIEEIGRGGMASVYRARQANIHRTVAVKVLPRTLLHDPSFYERFAREVDVVAHLEHPHILPIYDYGEADGTPYIAMRYLAGGSMAQWIRRGLPPLEKLPKPLEQIASALDYAHQQGIIHRDLKPGNIMLDENGNAYLSDFGIARVLNSNLTGSTIIGTPAYMSPEQANGLPLDARSDIYSLGIVVFELVTGKEPYEAETPVALLLKHINEPMPSARALRPELPPAAEQVIIKATAKHPDERYASATDLADAFTAALRTSHNAATVVELERDEPTVFDPDSLLKRTPPTGQRPATPASGTRQAEPKPPTRAASTAAHAEPEDLPITEPQRRRVSPVLIGVLVLIVLVVVAGVAFAATRTPPPATPSVMEIPTPFANAQTVRRDQYTISVPDDWVFADVSDSLGMVHLWQLDRRAYVRLHLVEKSKLTSGSNFQAAMDAFDAREVRPQNTLHFIDADTADDGSVRRSYTVDGTDSTLPGQVDYFYLNRGTYLVVVETFSAYQTGNDLVPTFQQVLDSLRVTQA